jgi:hypothetical protein
MKNFGPTLCGIAREQTLWGEYLGEFETEFEYILGC